VIHQAIQFVVTELNTYLNLRSPSLTADRAVLDSLFDTSGNLNADAKEKVVLSVVNVQEDPVYHSVEVYEKRPDGGAEMVRPEVRVNLFLLFIANFSEYDESLKALEHVISFFQTRHVFNYSSIPALSQQAGRMVFELYSMTFEQKNHLWGALGGKYQPSVMYKVGLVAIRDRQLEAEVRPVEQILINE
jgi:hypothetical protein